MGGKKAARQPVGQKMQPELFRGSRRLIRTAAYPVFVAAAMDRLTFNKLRVVGFLTSLSLRVVSDALRELQEAPEPELVFGEYGYEPNPKSKAAMNLANADPIDLGITVGMAAGEVALTRPGLVAHLRTYHANPSDGEEKLRAYGAELRKHIDTLLAPSPH